MNFILSLNSIFLLFFDSFVSCHVSKRALPLIFPPSSPTRHQLISGVGIPLGTPESITTGWVLKCQYFLPTAMQDLQANYWEDFPKLRKLNKREVKVDEMTGQKYESYSVDAEVLSVENGTLEEDELEFDDGDDDYWKDDVEDDFLQQMSTSIARPLEPEEIKASYDATKSRWTTYSTLEQVSKDAGFGGRPCVLRSICEAADAQFTHRTGVLGELLHIVFSPSTTKEPVSQHSDNEYYKAEELGRSGAPCHLIFHECKNSILDVFTGIHDPTESFANFLARHKK